MLAGHRGEALERRVDLRQPDHEAAQRELELGDGDGAISQPPRGEPAVDGRLHPRRDGRAIGVAGHQLARLHRELPAVIEDDLEQVDVRRPALRAAAVALARAVEEVAVAVVIKAPDRLQQLVDVLVGDRRGRRATRVQEDPAQRPAQPLLGSTALEPEPDGVLDEALQAELDPDLRGELADIEVPAGQHPRVVKPGMAGEPEEQQVAAGVVGRAVGHRAALLAGQTPNAASQRLIEPIGQVWVRRDEPPARRQSLAAVRTVDLERREDPRVLALEAMTAAIRRARRHRDRDGRSGRRGVHRLCSSRAAPPAGRSSDGPPRARR